MKNKAIRYHQLGSPFDVLALEELPMPTPLKGEVLIEMIASTIHPSDFGLINGSYGKLRDLPATGGREGVGKVVEAGPEVDGAILGKLVSMPEHQGVWQSEHLLQLWINQMSLKYQKLFLPLTVLFLNLK